MTSLKDVELEPSSVPPPAVLSTDAPPEKVDAVFRTLREFRSGLKSKANYHERLLIMISACIDHGINTRPRIIGTLARLGYNRARIAKTIDGAVGKRWSVQPDRIYRNLL